MQFRHAPNIQRSAQISVFNIDILLFGFYLSPLNLNAMRLTYLIAFILLLGFSNVTYAQLQCPTTAADTTTWTTHDEGDFSLKLPPGFETVEAQSVDSQVGRWKKDSSTVHYDLGSYANPLDPDEQDYFSELVVCQAGDAPDTPRIVVYRHSMNGTNKTYMGAHWAAPLASIPGNVSLTIVGTTPNAKNRSKMLAVFQSVRFNE